MIRYETLLFDLDHTLLDSDASEAAAFAATVRSIGLAPSQEMFDTYRTINRALWRAVERGEVTPVQVNLARFEQFTDAVGVDAEPRSMAATFTDGLGCNGELYAGAESMLDDLAGRHRLAMVTNGLSNVQRARIERLCLDRYFDAVVISAEVGTSKPGTDIFDIVFHQLGEPKRPEAIMIGDSLTSDIQGGVNYGIDTCWYNPSGKPVPAAASEGPTPTHEITVLSELTSLLRSAPSC